MLSIYAFTSDVINEPFSTVSVPLLIFKSPPAAWILPFEAILSIFNSPETILTLPFQVSLEFKVTFPPVIFKLALSAIVTAGLFPSPAIKLLDAIYKFPEFKLRFPPSAVIMPFEFKPFNVKFPSDKVILPTQLSLLFNETSAPSIFNFASLFNVTAVLSAIELPVFNVRTAIKPLFPILNLPFWTINVPSEGKSFDVYQFKVPLLIVLVPLKNLSLTVVEPADWVNVPLYPELSPLRFSVPVFVILPVSAPIIFPDTLFVPAKLKLPSLVISLANVFFPDVTMLPAL